MYLYVCVFMCVCVFASAFVLVRYRDEYGMRAECAKARSVCVAAIGERGGSD